MSIARIATTTLIFVAVTAVNYAITNRAFKKAAEPVNERLNEIEADLASLKGEIETVEELTGLKTPKSEMADVVNADSENTPAPESNDTSGKE